MCAIATIVRITKPAIGSTADEKRLAAIMDAMDPLRKAQIENIALITGRKADQGRTAGRGR